VSQDVSCALKNTADKSSVEERLGLGLSRRAGFFARIEVGAQAEMGTLRQRVQFVDRWFVGEDHVQALIDYTGMTVTRSGGIGRY